MGIPFYLIEEHLNISVFVLKNNNHILYQFLYFYYMLVDKT